MTRNYPEAVRFINTKAERFLPLCAHLWFPLLKGTLTLRFNALADFGQQFPASGRVAPLLPEGKSGFGLAFRDDVGDKVVEQSLHARAG
jgi:hypothetical protein